MILVIDNYDSFTYNLVHYLSELGARVLVRRNDAVTAEAALALRFSPKPSCSRPVPARLTKPAICLDILAKDSGYDLPILGVCLGHQAIAQAFGGQVTRAKSLIARQDQPDPPHRPRACSRACQTPSLPRAITAWRRHATAPPRHRWR